MLLKQDIKTLIFYVSAVLVALFLLIPFDTERLRETDGFQRYLFYFIYLLIFIINFFFRGELTKRLHAIFITAVCFNVAYVLLYWEMPSALVSARTYLLPLLLLAFTIGMSFFSLGFIDEAGFIPHIRLNQFRRIILVVGVLGVFMVFFFPQLVFEFTQFFNISGAFVSFLFSIYFRMRGHEIMGYWVTGTYLFLMGFLIDFLHHNKIVADSFISFYSVELGFLGMFLLMSASFSLLKRNNSESDSKVKEK